MRGIMRDLQEKRGSGFRLACHEVGGPCRERIRPFRIARDEIIGPLVCSLDGKVAVFIAGIAVALVIASIFRRKSGAHIPLAEMSCLIATVDAFEHLGQGWVIPCSWLVFCSKRLISLPGGCMIEEDASPRGRTDGRGGIGPGKTHACGS